MLYTLLTIVFIVVCLFLVLVVLLQQGKGSDVAAAFGGGGASQAAFGPRGSTTLLHKLTTGSFVLFVVLSIGLSVMTARKSRSVTEMIKDSPAVAAPGSTEPLPIPEAPATPVQEQPTPAVPQE